MKEALVLAALAAISAVVLVATDHAAKTAGRAAYLEARWGLDRDTAMTYAAEDGQ